MTFLEKYKQHYGELAMEDFELYRNHCPGEFAGVTGENVPKRGGCPDCDCEDCWNQQRTKPVLTVYVDGEDTLVHAFGSNEELVYAVVGTVRAIVEENSEGGLEGIADQLRHAFRPESTIWKEAAKEASDESPVGHGGNGGAT